MKKEQKTSLRGSKSRGNLSKAILGLIAVALIGFGVWKYSAGIAVSQAPHNNNKPIIKIGVIVPLSGTIAVMGEATKNALTMAKEDLAQRNLKNDYQFIVEDDGFEAKRTISLFKKQSAIDKVDAVISFSSQSGNIISPLAEKAMIINLNVGASDKNVAIGKYNFIHWTLPINTTKVNLDFDHKRGYKNVVLVTANNSGTTAMANALKENLRNYPEIKLNEYIIQPAEKDFRMLLSQIKELNPDVVQSLLYGDSDAAFIKQYREAAVLAPLVGSENFSVLGDLNVAEGLYYSDVALSKDDFEKHYNEKFPDSGTFAIGNTYDAVMLLVDAFEKADTKEKAVDELIKIKKYNGVIGKLTQDDEGIFHSNAVLKKVVNGKPVVVEE